MNKFINKLVKVKTIYGEEIMGIVIKKPVWVLYIKNNNGIIKIDIADIEDIVIIGDVIDGKN